jgi:hypothetical protein
VRGAELGAQRPDAAADRAAEQAVDRGLRAGRRDLVDVADDEQRRRGVDDVAVRQPDRERARAAGGDRYSPRTARW